MSEPLTVTNTTFVRTPCCGYNVLMTMRYVDGEYPQIVGEVPMCPLCKTPFNLAVHHERYGRSRLRVPPSLAEEYAAHRGGTFTGD